MLSSAVARGIPRGLWVLWGVPWLWEQKLSTVLSAWMGCLGREAKLPSLSAHSDRVKTWPYFGVQSFWGPALPLHPGKSQVFLRPPVFGLTAAFYLYLPFFPRQVRKSGSKLWAVAQGISFLGFHSSA